MGSKISRLCDNIRKCTQEDVLLKGTANCKTKFCHRAVQNKMTEYHCFQTITCKISNAIAKGVRKSTQFSGVFWVL